MGGGIKAADLLSGGLLPWEGEGVVDVKPPLPLGGARQDVKARNNAFAARDSPSRSPSAGTRCKVCSRALRMAPLPAPLPERRCMNANAHTLSMLRAASPAQEFRGPNQWERTQNARRRGLILSPRHQAANVCCSKLMEQGYSYE